MFLAAGCIVTCVPTGLMKLLKLAVKSPKFILKSVQKIVQKMLCFLHSKNLLCLCFISFIHYYQIH